MSNDEKKKEKPKKEDLPLGIKLGYRCAVCWEIIDGRTPGKIRVCKNELCELQIGDL